jgi:hypothetical protein
MDPFSIKGLKPLLNELNLLADFVYNPPKMYSKHILINGAVISAPTKEKNSCFLSLYSIAIDNNKPITPS